MIHYVCACVYIVRNPHSISIISLVFGFGLEIDKIRILKRLFIKKKNLFIIIYIKKNISNCKFASVHVRCDLLGLFYFFFFFKIVDSISYMQTIAKG